MWWISLSITHEQGKLHFPVFLGRKRPQIVASSPALLHCLTASGQTMEKGANTTIFLRKINVSAPFSIDFALSKINGEGSGMRRKNKRQAASPLGYAERFPLSNSLQDL